MVFGLLKEEYEHVAALVDVDKRLENGQIGKGLLWILCELCACALQA